MVRFSIFAVIAILFLVGEPAQAQEPHFRTTSTGVIAITPINTNFLFAPDQDMEPVLSGSVEYSFARSKSLGFELSGGYYPYFDRAEVIGRFGIRHFWSKSEAPVGGYWEMTAIGGASEMKAGSKKPEPLFGLGVRLGSVRSTRFGDFGFLYGGGPSIILIGGQTQVRLEFSFGIAYLLGRETIIE